MGQAGVGCVCIAYVEWGSGSVDIGEVREGGCHAEVKVRGEGERA
jgi:hypothetical protein